MISKENLPPAVIESVRREGDHSSASTLKQAVERAEEKAIREEKGDRLAAARRLGISKSTLYAKMVRYSIDD
ncbi:helix-turn-helix domain-containing protein [Aneurinibacillus tyrosinisolvens]|uniref:helix-turn-helix domain-containing protein n=1 Tax=Aneurinibacillus tyrosinisolvens TaxID=1443435 RepID=UPI0022A98CC9|nr:helix-turn-helix domain-containing protein [Aneurinibacillus tyrosinisolvens]